MDKERLYEDIPNIVLKHYDMDVDVRVQGDNVVKAIYTWIIFTPKKISALTPEPTNFYSQYTYWRASDTDKLSYEDAYYIRKDDMPLIKYISGEYYLDEFCEKLARKVTEETIEKIKSGEEVTRIPKENRVYPYYPSNDF